MRTTHEVKGLTITNDGVRLYDVTITVEDGTTATERVAADTEWQARTRAMAVNESLDLHGFLVANGRPADIAYRVEVAS